MGWEDYGAALRMRDTIKQMVSAELDLQRPRYQYATVASFNRTTRKCEVQFPGEVGTVFVNMGSVQPNTVGQVVRVDGLLGDRFIGDVLGQPWIGDANGVLNPQQLAIGTGAPHGSNAMERYQSGAWNLPNATWTDYAFNSENTSTSDTIQDDGAIYSSPYFQSQAAGWFIISSSVTFGAGNGFKALRFLTDVGNQLGREGFDQVTTPFRDMTLTTPVWLPGGGAGVKVQVYQSTGATLSMPAHAATAPCKVTFVQIA